MVVFPETSLDAATGIVERVRKVVENSVVRGKDAGDIRFTLSAGVGAFAKDQKNVSRVFERTDRGLYETKNAGRNRVVVKRDHDDDPVA